MSNTGSRTYSNIVISWTASTNAASLDVEIKAGGALIGAMTLTPDTPNNNLNYSNPPETASGLFTAEYGPGGSSGKLSCSDFKWSLTSGNGSTTGLIGTWSKEGK